MEADARALRKHDVFHRRVLSIGFIRDDTREVVQSETARYAQQYVRLPTTTLKYLAASAAKPCRTRPNAS